jgi:hypothetical protein
VRFYEKLGFVVVDDCTCPVGPGYRNWTMIREPNADATAVGGAAT